MARGLDHIVHAVHDLEAAAELYRRLGFQVGARNIHPRAWGTQNHVVQLPGTYIELLALADTSGMAPHGPGFFSFGAFNRDFLKRGQGLSMLVLEGQGAPDAAAFRSAGVGDFELFEFERESRDPDGAAIKLAFALAFAADPLASDIGFFSIRHRYPDRFWNPAFQDHPNTAAAVAGIVMVADNPGDHRMFLETFTGQRAVLATSAVLSIKTPRGEIHVMQPAAFRDRFEVDPPTTEHGGRLAALRFSLRDIDGLEARLRAESIPGSSDTGRIVVGPDRALGAALVFERN